MILDGHLDATPTGDKQVDVMVTVKLRFKPSIDVVCVEDATGVANSATIQP